MVIRKVGPHTYRLYSRRKNLTTGRRRNLGTYRTRTGAERRERQVEVFQHAKG